MVDLVPELKLIIGEQPPVPELPPQDAQRRFQLVFRRFIGVFARPEHPLALFLDDLQWLDAATLDLLEDLLTRPDVQHLMLIGAYRDNEVNSAHPLMRKLEAIREAGAKVQEIILAPLAREDLGQLIADALHCEPERVAPLAQLVHEKTAGNPFFAIQFISALAEEGLLTFDHGAARWSWDLESHSRQGLHRQCGGPHGREVEPPARRNAEGITAAGLPGQQRRVRHCWPWSTGRRERRCTRVLGSGSSGLVLRSEGAIRFLHDRVQEAAYSLIPEAKRAEAHLRIGQAARGAHAAGEARGGDLRDRQSAQPRRALDQLRAGTRATGRAELDRGQARESCDCVRLRPELSGHRAPRCYPRMAGREGTHSSFAMEIGRAECEFLTGDLAAAEERLATLFLRAANLVDKAAVACLRAALYTTLARSERAVEICVEYLREAGVACSPRPTDEEVSARVRALPGVARRSTDRSAFRPAAHE